MTRPNFKLLTSLLGGVLLAATPAAAQRSSSRSSPTPAPVPAPTVGPTIVIVGEEAAPPPPTSSRSRRSRSSGRSDAALELAWPKLGAGNTTTLDVNSNPRLRLLLPRMGISVPRDGILRKPRAMTAGSAPSGSAQPPTIGPIAMNMAGNFLVPDPLPPGGGPVIIVLAGEGGATTVSPTPAASSSRSSTDRRSSSGSTYPTWSGDSREGERPTQTTAATKEADEDDRPVVIRHDNLPKTAPSYWQALDQDHDAQLSLYEWRTGGKSVDDFLALDVNEDGQLVVDEYAQGVASAGVQPEPKPSAPPSSRYRR